MIRTQIQLSEEHHRWARAEAHRRGVSMAEVIRECIEGGMRRREPDRGELYERARPAVGLFEEPEGRDDVADRHDAYLTGSFEC